MKKVILTLILVSFLSLGYGVGISDHKVYHESAKVKSAEKKLNSESFLNGYEVNASSKITKESEEAQEKAKSYSMADLIGSFITQVVFKLFQSFISFLF